MLQARMNMVNRLRKWVQERFNVLDRRLKSADKKEQSGVRGEGRDIVLKEQKTKTKGNRHLQKGTTVHAK